MIVGQLSNVRGIVGRDSVIARALCGEISPKYAPDVRTSPDNAPGVIFPRAPESRPTTLRTSKARPKACGARQASDNTHMARHIQQKTTRTGFRCGSLFRLCVQQVLLGSSLGLSLSSGGLGLGGSPERPPPRPSWRPRRRTWQHAWQLLGGLGLALSGLLGSGLLGGLLTLQRFLAASRSSAALSGTAELVAKRWTRPPVST